MPIEELPELEGDSGASRHGNHRLGLRAGSCSWLQQRANTGRPCTRGGAAGLFVRPVSAWVRPRARRLIPGVGDDARSFSGCFVCGRRVFAAGRADRARHQRSCSASSVAQCSRVAVVVGLTGLARAPSGAALLVRLKPDTTQLVPLKPDAACANSPCHRVSVSPWRVVGEHRRIDHVGSRSLFSRI